MMTATQTRSTFLKRMIALICILMTVLSLLPAGAFAETKSTFFGYRIEHTGADTEYYTVTTEKKNAVLTINPIKGKAQIERLTLTFKTQVKKESLNGRYEVKVYDGVRLIASQTVTTGKKTIKLPNAGSYRVVVTYLGDGTEFLDGRTFRSWVTEPGYKMEVSKWGTVQ